jgi:taurine--2-oxoglutarate transaminase
MDSVTPRTGPARALTRRRGTAYIRLHYKTLRFPARQNDQQHSTMLAEAQTVLHTWCRQSEWAAPTITGGRGAHLFTDDGRSILDMSSLAECSNLGHQHPQVIEAIRAQATKLCLSPVPGALNRGAARRTAAGEVGLSGGRVFFTLAVLMPTSTR